MGNAIYRDLIQGSLTVDARYLALAVPIEYRYKSGGRVIREPSYAAGQSGVGAFAAHLPPAKDLSMNRVDPLYHQIGRGSPPASRCA
jgi:hypothetical protein